MTPSLSKGFGLTSEKRRDWVQEARARTIQLSPDEQRQLERAGEQLAKRTTRFGEFDPESTSSVIHCSRVDQAHCSVRVLDAVGIIATSTLELEVKPKIPQDHLLYLLSRAQLAPNFLPDRAHLRRDHSLTEVLAQWFVSALERLLHEGLARDYRPVRDEISHVRGRIAPLASASLYYRGRLSVVADFEEFDFDTPLNRTLREAARVVLSTAAFERALRRRASRAIARMDGVGLLRPDDLRAEPERRTGNYVDATMLAKQVIQAAGLCLVPDADPVWTFLIRTPEPVEAGIRGVLREAIPPELAPAKRSISLTGSQMTLNPDLVFGDGLSVADVKYKLTGQDWARSDLYEVIAFAVGLHTTQAALVGFREPDADPLPEIQVGDISVRHLDWPIDPNTEPEIAAASLGATALEWLEAATP